MHSLNIWETRDRKYSYAPSDYVLTQKLPLKERGSFDLLSGARTIEIHDE